MKHIEIFPWNDSFETGISIIDEQHKQLVQLLNELGQSVTHHSRPVELDRVFNRLTSYTEFHFKTEEGIWNSHFRNDDWLMQHEQTHHSFIEKIISLKNDQKDIPLEDLIQDILSFLTRWLAFHILDSDKRMAKAVIAIRAGKKLEDAKNIAEEEMSGSTQVLINTVLTMHDGLSSRTLKLMKEKKLREQAEADLLTARNNGKLN